MPAGGVPADLEKSYANQPLECLKVVVFQKFLKFAHERVEWYLK